MVDIIFEPWGPVDDAMFERAEETRRPCGDDEGHGARRRDGHEAPLLREHEVDYESVLEIARALREQIDWDEVWRRTSHSPYARTLFYLAEEPGILDERRTDQPQSAMTETG